MEEKKKRKKLPVILVCICLLLCGLGVTLAYLTSQAQKHNTLTAGETEVEVEEDFEPPEELKPGTEFKKVPRIKNTGLLECFIRVRVDFTHPKAAEFCTLIGRDEKWTDKQGDGYYYYKEAVPSGGKTADLFQSVKVSDTVNQADLVEFELLIYVEAVEHRQHEGTCTGDEYRKVWEDYKGGNGA